MNKTKDVAKYLIYAYEKYTKTYFENSELKLQKLMYLAQRESLCLTGNSLIDESFIGWKYGPVLKSLRFYFEDNFERLNDEKDSKLTLDEKYIINNVIAQYGQYESWYLADLTHNEISWKNSRKGLIPNQNGDRPLLLEDIIEDAKKIRPYDYIFDMYIDEFEDAKEFINE